MYLENNTMCVLNIIFIENLLLGIVFVLFCFVFSFLIWVKCQYFVSMKHKFLSSANSTIDRIFERSQK